MKKKYIGTLIISTLLVGGTFANNYQNNYIQPQNSNTQEYQKHDSLKDRVKTRWNKIKSKLQEEKERLKEGIAKRYDNMPDKYKEKIKSISNKFRSYYSTLREKIKQEYHYLGNKYRNMLISLKEKYKNATSSEEKEKIKKKFYEIKSEMRTKLNSLKEKYYATKKEEKEKIKQEYNKVLSNKNSTYSSNTIRQEVKHDISYYKNNTIINKYEKLLESRYSEKLSKLDVNKLKNIQFKIKNVLNRIVNSNKSEKTKTRVVSYLSALNNVIDKKIKEKLENKGDSDKKQVMSILQKYLGN